jgi:predicted peptidase
MKQSLPFIFSLLCTALVLSGCKKEAATTPVANTEKNLAISRSPIQTAVSANISDNTGGFYQSIPASYDASTKKYPLLVFLHGVNELGNGTTDLPKLLVNGVPRLLNQKTFPSQFTVNSADFSFIVISPQFKQWPQPADVNAMIDYAIKNLRVDITRIYVAGISMGGGAALDYAMAYPNRIAAVVSIAGASWQSREICGNISKANLPVWAFHNNDDTIVDASTTHTIIDNINSFNTAVAAKKTIWPTGGHDAWSKATNPAIKECDGKNMYEWMLQYSRNALTISN